jgi:hypothetical protein
MKLLSKISPLFLCSVLLLQGCVSPQSDTAQFIATAGNLDQQAYREKAAEFIRYAQAGDADQMLRITSKLSYATQSDSVRVVYTKQVIPAFRGTVVTWRSRGIACMDENGNVGFTFVGTAHGEKTHSFNIVVYEESGALVVANLSRHHWYN